MKMLMGSQVILTSSPMLYPVVLLLEYSVVVEFPDASVALPATELPVPWGSLPDAELPDAALTPTVTELLVLWGSFPDAELLDAAFTPTVTELLDP